MVLTYRLTESDWSGTGSTTLPSPGKYRVEFAQPDGVPSRAQRDLEKLCRKRHRICSQFRIRFERLAEGMGADRKLSLNQFEQLSDGDGIFEIKVTCDEGVFRCFCFMREKGYFLTHCEEKSDSNQWYSEQIRIAQAIRTRHRD